MKKQYIKPEMEMVKLKQSNLICLSGPIDGDATEPAGAPMRGFDEEDIILW